eukprot:TRINITY_DN7855_c0_g1_i3.p1 TRINITY_DN7855_c0_g1~~TRINITY_DN7855_c0_g1_i3.p1  ORF type:complete len:269 (+),score=56.30 TRINITY_DN7855_c0_g1_i3:833-1639(+)
MPRGDEDDEMIRFNVGGQYFLTTRTTIFASGKDNMLARMIDGELPLLKDQKGNIVIDRDGTCFQYILNFLRDGSLLFPTDQHFLQLLLREARYYCVTGLVQHLELKIVHAADLPAFISVIRSEEELDRAVEATRHGLPALRLVLSRGNNKFSYVSNADERLLDNHELFLKLTTKFRNRITFLFETGNRTSDICSWYFYGHGELLSEVSCVSMVYTSSHTQTRIEFPQGKIYEQAMNLMLYEPGLEPVSPTRGKPQNGRQSFQGSTSEI